MPETTTHHAFTIPGQPVPKARPRLGQHGNVYTPRATKDYEKAVGWAAKAAHVPLLQGPLKVTVFVYGRKGRKDADNCLKSILDGLNGVAYQDDSQVQDARIAWTGGSMGGDATVVHLEALP